MCSGESGLASKRVQGNTPKGKRKLREKNSPMPFLTANPGKYIGNDAKQTRRTAEAGDRTVRPTQLLVSELGWKP
jgi:hypothetical protein